MNNLDSIEKIIQIRIDCLSAHLGVPVSINLEKDSAQALFEEMKSKGMLTAQTVTPRGFWPWAKPSFRIGPAVKAKSWKNLEGCRLFGMTIHIKEGA